jgi:hypothetical protein
VTQVDNIEVKEIQEDVTEPSSSEATFAATDASSSEPESNETSSEATPSMESTSSATDEPEAIALNAVVEQALESEATFTAAEASSSGPESIETSSESTPSVESTSSATDEPEAIASIAVVEKVPESVSEPVSIENAETPVLEATTTFETPESNLAAEIAAESVAEDAASSSEPAISQTAEERVASLEAEVNAAPHKVYSLGKVRRVVAELKTAGEAQELRDRARVLETGILAQIAQRKTAKEAICEHAEALQGSNEWRAAGDKLRGLFEEWKLIGGAGKKLDDELWQRFINAREHFSKRRTEHFAERQQVWAVAKVKKEELIAEAEALGASTEWRSTADKIRSLQDQWKAAGSAGRDVDDALWNRFNAAKQAFFDTRTSVWDANKAKKEALCHEAEALKESSDWRLTGEAMKAMQVAWKEAGSAGKAAEDKLWERFRAATNFFFERREAALSGRRQDERENLVKKQDLVAKAEALLYSTDGLSAGREVRELQAKWKAIGHASREQADELWTRFRAATERIAETASSERDRQQTEWQIRMKDAMTRKREQLASTRTSIEADEANLQRWRASLSETRPGGKSAEIEASLDAKILDVINRIRAKNERVEELRATIADMDAKMKD